ncbi:MAG: PP2C family protein-serine/threonine phosphatase [Synechococcus sp.]|nr:PP2C family protein-serine/threonine phosphatase [Synechococcus sp.]
MTPSASNFATPKYFDPVTRESELQVAPEQSETRLETTIGDDVEFLRAQIAKLNREQTKVQDLLSSLGFALRSFNNLNQFLELTPLMSARVVDADGGALVLFDAQGQIQLEKFYCGEGGNCQAIREAFAQVRPATTGPTAAAPICTAQEALELDEQLQEYLGDTLRVCSTPILVKNITRGKLYVFSRDPHYSWDITRRKLVQLVADQTAVAIANNDLTSKLRSKEKQDRELEIASEIQNHLLPSECPQIKGLAIAADYRNAYRVGGDYYDFIPTNYDRIRRQDDPKLVQCLPWSIVIGDVMGKGVPAGLIMTMTRGMLRAEVLNRHSPAKILEHLNRVMYADLDNSHRFVTLFYSEYDPKTRTLSYSNAAHHPPLLWRAQTHQIESLDTQGMLIGLDLDSEYEDAQVVLEAGDIILYYTDGFTDAVNAHGDRFDEENLVRVFQSACQSCQTPEAIVQELFTQVEKFTYPKVRGGDDMTLVVVQVQSEAVLSNPCQHHDC